MTNWVIISTKEGAQKSPWRSFCEVNHTIVKFTEHPFNFYFSIKVIQSVRNFTIICSFIKFIEITSCHQKCF